MSCSSQTSSNLILLLQHFLYGACQKQQHNVEDIFQGATVSFLSRHRPNMVIDLSSQRLSNLSEWAFDTRIHRASAIEFN